MAINLFKNRKQKNDNKDRFTRIDDTTYRDNVTGELITTFMSGRRARRIGRAFLRLGKMKLFLFSSVILVGALFIIAFMQEKTGNFTVNLDRLELYRKGISISADADFTQPTARLTASPIDDVTNISGLELPDDLNEIDGEHNGSNYMAYTYYIRNSGKEPVSYKAVISMDSATKGAEYAVRLAVWRNDEKTVYAMPAANGDPEAGCTSFDSHEIVCQYDEDDFEVGYVDKYTVVIWLEGDDPECVDSIVGGGLEFSMKIAAASEDDTSLMDKFIQDIRDSVNGDKSIGASGTESPDNGSGEPITWNNRKNKKQD